MLAFAITDLPRTTVGQAVVTVAFPLYSKISKDRDTLIAAFERTLDASFFLAFASSVVIFLCIPDYAVRLLGSGWSGMEAPVRCLAVFGMLRFAAMPFAPLFKAAGSPDLVWKLHLIRICVVVPLTVWAAPFGIVGVAAAQVPAGGLLLLLSGSAFLRLMRCPSVRVARFVIPHAAGAATACGIVGSAITVQHAIGATMHSALLMSILSIAVYGFIVAKLRPNVRRTAEEFMPWRRHAGPVNVA